VNVAPEFWSVADVGRRITAGEISAVALVEPMLERIASLDGSARSSRSIRPGRARPPPRSIAGAPPASRSARSPACP
jgi:hypothetical protein